jgi:uncharacterized protein YcnI
MTPTALRLMVLLAAGLCVLPGTASAHVTVLPQQSRAGATQRYTMRVPTEGQVTTTSVVLEVPADVTITAILGSGAYTYEFVRQDGRIVRVIWTQDIKPGEAREFVFLARNPRAGAITWRARQRFADGSSTDWAGPPGDRRPASVVKLTP